MAAFLQFDFRLKTGVWITACGMLAFGLAMLIYGVQAAVNERILRDAPTEIEAEVTETRITFSEKTGRGHEVKYRFTLPGQTGTFTRSDETGRRDLWSTLTEEAYGRAERARKLKVVYSPANPWINHPVEAGSDSMFDALTAAILLGLAPIVLAVLIGLVARSEYRQLVQAQMAGRLPEGPISYYTITPRDPQLKDGYIL